MGEPVFSIMLGGTKHHVVVSPSTAKSVFAFRGKSNSPLVNHVMEKVFGDSGTVLNMDSSDMHVLHQNIGNSLLGEPFVTETTTATVRRIERQTPNLVTFSPSIVDQLLWERPSDIEMDPNSNQKVCEANLFALVRNFAAYITTTGFFGQTLLEVFPNLLKDLWTLDSQFNALSKGAPRWLPAKGISAAYAARDRLLQVFAIFHEAFVAWDDGRDPGLDFRDLDDVSEPIKQRVRGLHNMGYSAAASAPAYLSLLWAMNGNTTNVIFWNLLRIYADPSLLEEIRKEISPYVKAFRPSREETGFPVDECAQLSMHSQGLLNSCPLLKASFYECLRLDTAGFSFRQLSSDLTLFESSEDAATDGLENPRVYKVTKGKSVAVAHGAVQNDPRYFSNPSQYDPLRFITTDPDTNSKRAKLHTIRPFGGGVFGCKGRIIAEKENLAYVAAIVALWDIESIKGAQLEVPEHKSSPGSYLPKNDVRVRMRIRV